MLHHSVNLPKLKDLLDARAHLGHLSRRWHPNMAPFIFMKKSQFHLIDLNKTLQQLQEAALALQTLARSGKKILFVAETDRQHHCGLLPFEKANHVIYYCFIH